MADQRSVEVFAFRLARRTFGNKRHAQGLSISLSAFSRFLREYLDPVVKTDQFAQYVDDIGRAANNDTDFIRNTQSVFQCICQAALDLRIERCHFAVRQVEFHGSTISSEGISPQARKTHNFTEKFRFPQSKEAVQRYLGFVNDYIICVPRMAKKLSPF